MDSKWHHYRRGRFYQKALAFERFRFVLLYFAHTRHLLACELLQEALGRMTFHLPVIQRFRPSSPEYLDEKRDFR